MSLSDQQQAYLMLAVFVLPAVIAWLANGAPTDRTTLSILGGAILSGVLAYIKEALGNSSPVSVPTGTPAAKP
jgi:hypothetical protein